MKLKKKILTIILYFGFNILFSQDDKLCENIYGKWEMYRKEFPFGIVQPKKVEIWVFNANGKFFMNNKELTYVLFNNCKKIKIGKNVQYSILKLTRDSLIVRQQILPHEYYQIYLKKIK